MKTEDKRTPLRGIGAAPGVVVGELYLYRPCKPAVRRRSGGDPGGELARYAGAKDRAARELRGAAAPQEGGPPEQGAIFAAQLELLLDEEVDKQVRARILREGCTAEFAVQAAYGAFAALFEEMDDPLIRERKADVADVSLRLLRILEGGQGGGVSALPRPVIVAAHDLLPSDTAGMDRKNVLGILTEAGNVTSHTAILARSYGIPAVVGIPGLMESLESGMQVLADADGGAVYPEPDEALLRDFGQKKREREARLLLDRAYLKREAETRDGVRILIGANIGGPGEDLAAQAEDVDCAGLFRTEFLYMERARLPKEEEQFQAYRAVLQAYSGKPVLLRTVDIGGDKSVPCLDLPKEDNPFLGVRALRLCYERPQLLKTQLRAALRASAFGRLELMFPMVSSMEDVRWAKAMLREAGEELDAEGVPWDRAVPVGIMMEIPAVMLIADQAAREVDFASVGTNDLCQYLTAADRLNPGTARYYQSFHPALFRLTGYAVREFARRGKQVGVCGELGGDPLAAPVLVGLGVRKLSMSHGAVAGIKRALSALTLGEMERLAERVLACGTEGEARRAAEEALAGPE